MRAVHAGWTASWSRAFQGRVERTCSSIRSSPPGRSTRRTSASPARGSGTLQKTSPHTTVSKTPARKGSASARARTSGTAGARRRARPSEGAAGSTPTTRTPAA